MTAVALFDALAAEEANGPRADERREQLAARLVESSLSDWQRVRQYEDDFSPANFDDLERVREIDRSICAMHSQWLAEAEEVCARARQVAAGGRTVPKIDELENAIGFTQARLMATPGQFVRAIEQVKRGEVIPAKEMRDELNARLRARC